MTIMSIATDPTTEQLIAELYKIDGKAEIVGGTDRDDEPDRRYAEQCRRQRFAVSLRAVCEATRRTGVHAITRHFLVDLPNRKSFCSDARTTPVRAQE